MSAPFFTVTATHNPYRWYLPLEDSLCVGPPGAAFMFGGVGMAAAISALEGACARPVVWATAQYLSFARPPSVLDLDVRTPVHGRHTTQARVIAHVGDREILTVNAALGARPGDIDRQWVRAPSAPPPLDCEESSRWNDRGGDLHSRIEVRVAQGSHQRAARGAGAGENGRLVLWMRPRGGHAVDSTLLAIMADHVPSGIGAALGRNAGGNSLDNTIRFLAPAETEWVLCDVQIEGAHAGFAHGVMRLFSQEGRLMALASQSMILRLREGQADLGHEADARP